MITTTTGKSTFGELVDLQPLIGKRPSTTSASITMVANTGFFRLTRVNHMGQGRSSGRASGFHRRAARRVPTVPLTRLALSGRPLTKTITWPSDSPRAPSSTARWTTWLLLTNCT